MTSDCCTLFLILNCIIVIYNTTKQVIAIPSLSVARKHARQKPSSCEITSEETTQFVARKVEAKNKKIAKHNEKSNTRSEKSMKKVCDEIQPIMQNAVCGI